MNGNDGNIYTPQYAVYDNGRLDKVALFNYVTDPSGAAAYTTTLHFNGDGAPGEVYVKYLTSASVSNKDDIRWAGQASGKRLQKEIFSGSLRMSDLRNSIQCRWPTEGRLGYRDGPVRSGSCDMQYQCTSTWLCPRLLKQR